MWERDSDIEMLDEFGQDVKTNDTRWRDVRIAK